VTKGNQIVKVSVVATYSFYVGFCARLIPYEQNMY